MKVAFTANQIILVTGATSGIGREIALQLNAAGASVIGIGRCAEELEKTKHACTNPGCFHSEVKDLTAELEILPAYVTELKKKYGKFHGLVSCAGTGGITPVRTLTAKHLNTMFTLNTFAPLLLAKGFCDKRNNTGTGASAVFISSIAAQTAHKGHTAYAGSKAALNAGIQAIAKEMAPSHIRLNLISPSDIQTEATLKVSDEAMAAERASTYPMGFGEPADVANMALFLLSSQAKWITGQNYTVDCASV